MTTLMYHHSHVVPVLLDMPAAAPMLYVLYRLYCLHRSWDTPRAVKYREINHISGLRGTAVNVQAMGGLGA
jgi:hypothetical protein